MFSYDQREQCRPIIDKCIYIISLLEYMPPTYARDILFEVLHAPSFNPLMVLKNCPIEYSDAVDHIMIIERNLMSPCLDNVASTCCDNVVNDCCSFKRGSCQFLKKLLKTEELIDLCHVFSIVIYELLILSPCCSIKRKPLLNFLFIHNQLKIMVLLQIKCNLY